MCCLSEVLLSASSHVSCLFEQKETKEKFNSGVVNKTWKPLSHRGKDDEMKELQGLFIFHPLQIVVFYFFFSCLP